MQKRRCPARADERIGQKEGRIWHNELCNDDGTNKFSFCEVKHTTDSYDYDMLQQPLGPEKAITFSVKAHNDAHIGFFSAEDATPHSNSAQKWNVDSGVPSLYAEGPGYEIVLCGWGATQSVIRATNQGKSEVAMQTRNLISDVEFRQFWSVRSSAETRPGTPARSMKTQTLTPILMRRKTAPGGELKSLRAYLLHI
jgi:hypothetical protein